MDTEFMQVLLAKAISGMENDKLGELIKEAWVSRKSRGAANLTAGEIVRDMFLEGDLHKVPSKKQLEVGRPEAATGADAERMVEHYSDPAPQTPNGRTAKYEQLESMFGEMKGSMKALADSMIELTKLTAEAAKSKVVKADKEDDEEDVEVEVNQAEDDEEDGKGKSLRAQASKTIMVKAEEDDEEEGTNQSNDEEEEDEEGKGKSLSDASKIKFAKALIGGAEDALKKGKGPGLRREIEKAARKAYGLVAVAVESKDKETAKAAKFALTSVEEFMFLNDIAVKAKKMKKDGANQKKWADKEGMEKSITDLQAMLHGLVNTVDNISRSKGGVPGIEVLSVNSPLAKGGTEYFAGKIKTINDKADAGMISENEQAAAEEMLSLMQAAAGGKVSESVIKNTVLMATPAVKAIFPEWMPGAKE